MLSFKDETINNNSYISDLPRYQDNQEGKPNGSSNFNSPQLFSLLNDFYFNLEQNDFEPLAKCIETINNLIKSSDEICILKIQEFDRMKNTSFIDTVFQMVINPPFLDHKLLYLTLLAYLFSIKTSKVTEQVIHNFEYIQFLNTVLFQLNYNETIATILHLILFITEHLTTLKVRFCKIFPVFNFERILFLYNTFNQKPIQYTIIQIASKLCINLGYGEFYLQLIDFLIENYDLNYDPIFLFEVLNQFIEKNTKYAFDDFEKNGFLFGKEGKRSVYDFLSPESFKYLGPNIITNYYYQYSYNTLKFLNNCMKVKEELKNEILNNLPIDDICVLIFNQFSSNDLVCLALKMLILDFHSNEEQKNFIFKIFYDRIESSQKVCQMFVDGNFKLRYRLLTMINLTVQSLLYQNDVKVVEKFLDKSFIQVVADMLLIDDEKLSSLVIQFLNIVISKARKLGNRELIECISVDWVVEALNNFIYNEKTQNEELVKSAENILAIIIQAGN
ncbi:hypothetical protein M9Y10_009139 [Tritrichomonas musculus]|uniref:SPIN90/Ldb17 leucine-rich domain-containing protein n=1 Tax=Tritrichomonas musculus TaxID=1915356 RepID=A0ABR2J2L8_9EUKA